MTRPNGIRSLRHDESCAETRLRNCTLSPTVANILATFYDVLSIDSNLQILILLIHLDGNCMAITIWRSSSDGPGRLAAWVPY